jgi:Big-like domain-containing protein
MVWILLLSACVSGRPDSAGPKIQIKPLSDPRQVKVIAIVPGEILSKIPAGKLAQDQGEAWLRFSLLNEGKEGPPILGTYERSGKQLVFMPRHPLTYKESYRARFGKAVADYRVPARAPTPPAVVQQVYPTSPVLPANHLKFIITFSKPMRGGDEIFDQIEILDAQGNAVHDPWLRDEIWDEKGQRLILYIHPGRIKWGVLLRMLFGPVLRPDREYTLVIRAAMRDADGQPLGKDHCLKFCTSAEDRERIAVADWTVKPIRAGSKQALVLEFNKVMDINSLKRLITITDEKGRPVAGTIEVGKHEHSWSFQPSGEWRPEQYTITVDRQLEDVAGNTPMRPFDVDLKAAAPSAPQLQLRFRPGK